MRWPISVSISPSRRKFKRFSDSLNKPALAATEIDDTLPSRIPQDGQHCRQSPIVQGKWRWHAVGGGINVSFLGGDVILRSSNVSVPENSNFGAQRLRRRFLRCPVPMLIHHRSRPYRASHVRDLVLRRPCGWEQVVGRCCPEQVRVAGDALPAHEQHVLVDRQAGPV